MIVLGISALYHDSAAAICIDGDIVAAVQEERFTRKKHDSSLPIYSIRYCLDKIGKEMYDIDKVVYYDNPVLTLDRFVHNLIAEGRDGNDLFCHTAKSVFQERLMVTDLLRKRFGFLGIEDKLYILEHHLSHAASAYYPSPFERAAVLTIDGVGEYATTTLGIGEGQKISIVKEIDYPHSLGLLYSTFTSFCGFKVNSGDYKFMGLAPYGKPIYYEQLREKVIDVKEDGSYRLNLDYFDFYKKSGRMYSEKMEEMFGGTARKPESEITRREMDIAASVQKLTEEIVIGLAREAKRITQCENLCMAGGVALNCVANGKLLEENLFDNIWIQPAAGDAGGALGCALYATYVDGQVIRKPGEPDLQKGSYLGPEYSGEEIKLFLDQNNYPYKEYDDKERLYQKIASELSSDKVVGWFQGRMEYGPRALGNRSILADPRSKEMQSKLNLKIKFRESFRPFAPSVLAEKVNDYFELEKQSPYMLLCADVKEKRRKHFDLEGLLNESSHNMLPVVNAERSDIPAVTHVDYSARIQTVDKGQNYDYYRLIKEFEKLTGYGVLVNTSFNVRGEPIVCSPEDAYLCFMRTEMDVLVMENYVLYKEEQQVYEETTDWRSVYELD